MTIWEVIDLIKDNTHESNHVVDIDNLIKSLMDESNDYVEYAKYAIDCDGLDPNDLFDQDVINEFAIEVFD